MASEHYQVRRSARRRTTMGIVREGGALVVVVPARMSRQQEQELVPAFVSRYLTHEASRRPPAGDAALTARAQQLFATYLAGEGAAPPFTVAWSSRQRQRWGSCTSATGAIRLSEQLRTMPDWVGDHVLVHELAHLLERTHSPRFHALVARYELSERAQGFLDGWLHAQQLPAVDY